MQEGLKGISPFIKKAFTILNTVQYADVVCWSSDGKQFRIEQVLRFQQEILPLFYKHGKLDSFKRQLYMYGFKKSAGVCVIFQHPNFIQGNPQLLRLIKRKSSTRGSNQASVGAQISAKVPAEEEKLSSSCRPSSTGLHSPNDSTQKLVVFTFNYASLRSLGYSPSNMPDTKRSWEQFEDDCLGLSIDQHIEENVFY